MHTRKGVHLIWRITDYELFTRGHCYFVSKTMLQWTIVRVEITRPSVAVCRIHRNLRNAVLERVWKLLSERYRPSSHQIVEMSFQTCSRMKYYGIFIKINLFYRNIGFYFFLLLGIDMFQDRKYTNREIIILSQSEQYKHCVLCRGLDFLIFLRAGYILWRSRDCICPLSGLGYIRWYAGLPVHIR